MSFLPDAGKRKGIPMKIIIHGAAGHMGRTVEETARTGFAGAEIAALVDPCAPAGGEAGCYAALADYPGPADAVVDFSHHTAAAGLLDYCVERALPVVVATTGHTAEEKALICAAAEKIPVFFSANMSVGVAVLADLARRAAAAFPSAEIEIVEIHHDRKLDVPSGTALLLADAVRDACPDKTLLVGRHENGKRTAREIGIHSLRLGNEVGTHEILISTGSETITLKHKIDSRALFAEGALRAAAFLIGKPAGLYRMEDMLK